MLPTAGYFKTIPCPYFIDNGNCTRAFCHYKHDTLLIQPKIEPTANIKVGKSVQYSKALKSYHSYLHFFLEIKQEKEDNVVSYNPTPLSILRQRREPSPTPPPVPAYQPTPITQIKEEQEFESKMNIVSSIIASENNVPKFESHRKSTDSSSSGTKSSSKSKEKSSSSKSHKSSSRDKSSSKEKSSKDRSSKSSKDHRHSSSSESDRKLSKSDDKHKSKSKHKSHKDSKDRKRSTSSSDESKGSKRAKTEKDHKNGHHEEDVPDSVLAFLDAMDDIDKKLGKDSKPSSKRSSSPVKKIVKEDASFLSEISRPDKVLAKKAKEAAPRSPTKSSHSESGKGRIRISSVQSSESGLTSAMIARRTQPNNPVRAMLNRVNKARMASQTRDIEDQLSALTGEEPMPSTSSGSSGKIVLTGSHYLLAIL